MHNSKIYSILKYFDKYEQNRLRKYLLSPYFNKSKSIVQLFNSLIEHINESDSLVLEKEDLWSILYPNSSFDDIRFRKVCSDLLKLVESFLAQQQYETNPLHQATYLVEAVGEKRMEKLFKSSMRTARRLSSQQLYRPPNYYFYQYQIEKNYHELSQSTLNRSSKSNEEEIINHLDHFYLSEKLRIYCGILSRQKFAPHEYNLLFIDEIIEHLNKHKYDEIPMIAIYYQIYLTQTDAEEEAHYFKLKELLEKYAGKLTVREANDSYSQTINYCISKINSGQQHFLSEFIEMNETLIKKGFLMNDELSPWKYQNIVIAALRLGRYEWTEDFIYTYKDILPESYRENALTFNLATLYWYQKKYEEVMNLLREVEYEDITYNLGSKAMLLATYYELDETEPLFSLMEAFRTYLNRHKKDISQQRRKNFTNLISFINRISKVKIGDKKKLAALRKDLDEMQGIAANRQWLQEKIAELE